MSKDTLQGALYYRNVAEDVCAVQNLKGIHRAILEASEKGEYKTTLWLTVGEARKITKMGFELIAPDEIQSSTAQYTISWY